MDKNISQWNPRGMERMLTWGGGGKDSALAE